MFKNVAGQKFRVFAFDPTTGLPVSGDAANITAYISKDYGAVTVLADTSAAEEQATNGKGYYLFDAAQAETNADNVNVTGKSSTSNVVVVGAPASIDTRPANAGLMSIDGSGRVDVGSVGGTAQTARDIGADTASLVGRLTAARAGYLDNLNVGGVVASQADVIALNQSASRRIILTTVVQYERPESGTTTYTVEARTYDGDGAATNADTTPTLTATGAVSGSLAANLSAATNPATGVYRWTYTVAAAAVTEQIRFDVSAAISASTFTLAAYTQVVDVVSATWTTADRVMLTAINGKLPVNNIADQTLLAAAVGTPMQAGSTVVLTDGSVTTAKFAAGATVPRVTLVDTTTTNTDATATAAAAGAAAGAAVTTAHGAGSYATATGFAVPGSAMTLADGAITEAKIATPAEAAGIPTGILAMIRRLFERHTNKRTRNRTTGVQVLRNAADAGNLEAATQSTAGDTDTITAAS